MLAKGESTYQEELKIKYEVEALDTFQKYNITDVYLDRVPEEKERWIVDKERCDVLIGNNNENKVFVKLIKKIGDDNMSCKKKKTGTKPKK